MYKKRKQTKYTPLAALADHGEDSTAKKGSEIVKKGGKRTAVKNGEESTAKIGDDSAADNGEEGSAADSTAGMVQCPYCDHKCKNRDDLFVHKHQKHTRGPMCIVCDVVLKSVPKKISHMEKHGAKPYKCDKCSKAYCVASSMLNHRLVHFTDRTIACSYCDKKYKRVTSLRTHELRYHSKRILCNQEDAATEESGEDSSAGSGEEGSADHSTVGMVQCQFCKHKCKNEDDLFVHKHKVHTRGLMCVVCDVICKSPEAKKEHMVEHGEKPYKCDKCSNTYVNAGDMLNHRLVHFKERNNTCSVCSRKFKNIKTLRAHMKLQHNDMMQCNQEKAEKKNEMLDKEEKKGIECDQRKMKQAKYERSRSWSKRPTQESLSGHLMTSNTSFHKSSQTATRTLEAKDSLSQAKSNKTSEFSKPSNIEEYVIDHRIANASSTFEDSGEEDSGEEDSVEDSTAYMVQCPYCECICKNQDDLFVHKHRKHTRGLMCIVCDFILKSKEAKKEHVVEHGEKPYKCDKCSRSYSFASVMLRHRIMHLGKPKLSCKIYGKRYKIGFNVHQQKKVNDNDVNKSNEEKPEKKKENATDQRKHGAIAVNNRTVVQEKVGRRFFNTWKISSESDLVHPTTSKASYSTSTHSDMLAVQSQEINVNWQRKTSCETGAQSNYDIVQHPADNGDADTTFKCTFCGEQFTSHQAFELHLDTHFPTTQNHMSYNHFNDFMSQFNAMD